MPNRDRTGPMGEGARTGRGLGPCGGNTEVGPRPGFGIGRGGGRFGRGFGRGVIGAAGRGFGRWIVRASEIAEEKKEDS